MRALIVVALVIGSLRSAPVVLSNDDIDDSYVAQPEDLRSVAAWLGLFITDNESRVAVTRVRFVKRGEPNGDLKIETMPANATLLVSGVPAILPGPATTVAQFVDLSHDQPDTQMRLHERVYTIRLQSHEPDYCDAVISVTSGAVTQTLYDIRDPLPRFSCDEPHFKIHWAGDLDRDGRLDLLVTFSEKYSYFPRQLFLSSAARGRNLVAEGARYERFSQ